MAQEILSLTKELKNLVSKYETTAFLKFIAFLFMQMPSRSTNPFLMPLMSPMRQLFYVAEISVRTQTQKNPKIPYQYETWDKDWTEICALLATIEQSYFIDVGFFKSEDGSIPVDKIKVVLPTFMNYFFNGPLTYQEQEMDRIQRLYSQNAEILHSKTGMVVEDFIYAYERLVDMTNRKLNEAIRFYRPGEWEKFTKKAIDKGLSNPKDWLKEDPEAFDASFRFMKDPGSIFIFSIDELADERLSIKNTNTILDLISTGKNETDELQFYTGENTLLQRPIFKVNDETYLLLYHVQVLTAIYRSLFAVCKEVKGDKIYKQRDYLLEKKVMDICRNFFGKEAFIYSNYNVDMVAEQDILVLYKSLAIIIEVKTATYREPMRNPEKAYDKLMADFKSSIQYGYDQIWRVKRRFLEEKYFVIYSDKNEPLYTIKPQRYKEVFSIIVTQERFGFVQSDLSELLEIEERDNSFPWSITVDDLEVFLLALKKKSAPIQSLSTFLNYRQLYHGHLLCGDELEMCALFMADRHKFISMADRDESIVTDPTSTNYFEKLYEKGLGLPNEMYIKHKQDGSLGYLFSE